MSPKTSKRNEKLTMNVDSRAAVHIAKSIQNFILKRKWVSRRNSDYKRRNWQSLAKNNIKINTLSKVHLKELEDLKRENINLHKRFEDLKQI